MAGRDIYIREGCYTCHSQMMRPMRAEVLRYGEWTRAGEYAYDHPFLLGSRRLGPDLQRVGGKYPDAWHYEHMRDPREHLPRQRDAALYLAAPPALRSGGHPGLAAGAQEGRACPTPTRRSRRAGG